MSSKYVPLWTFAHYKKEGHLFSTMEYSALKSESKELSKRKIEGTNLFFNKEARPKTI